MAEESRRAVGELSPGGLVAGGRYKLLDHVGGVAGQSFWHARDQRLRREVALTFVDPLPGETPPGSAHTTLDRTMALAGLYSYGLARVIDVIRGRGGGIVVAEWTPGRPLVNDDPTPLNDDPTPRTATAALVDLADAATSAESSSLVLGLDSPERFRIAENGRVVLAFPGVPAEADATDDVRGLGGVLYALLTGRWPEDSNPADPQSVREDVPADAAVLALRALDGSSVSSAATVRAMIGGPAPLGATSSLAVGAGVGAGLGAPAASVGRASGDNLGADGPGSGSQVSGLLTDTETDHSGYETESAYSPEPTEDEATQQRRWMIMAGSGAAFVVVIILLSSWLLGAFSGSEASTPLTQQLDAIERSAKESRAAAASSTAPAPTSAAKPAAPTPVKIEQATAWQPSTAPGSADNPGQAANTVDGSDSTTWATDTYYAQFGVGGAAYKPGLGLMLTLPDGAEPTSLSLKSPDDGIKFEVRSAQSASPASLEGSTVLGTGTVSSGTATVTLSQPAKSQYLLVWITSLRGVGPQSFRATVSEITLAK